MEKSPSSYGVVMSEIDHSNHNINGPTMTQHQPTYGFHYREAIVEAYSSMIAEKMDEGREGYFVNLMFNHLPGSRRNHMDTMRQEVERVHWILAKHMIHRPNHRNWAHLRPIFVGGPD